MPISLDTFQSRVARAGDSDILKLDDQNKPRAAKEGFFGRAVRWLVGPGGQERAQTATMMRDLYAGLKAQYGEDIANNAIRFARTDARLDEAGGLYLRPAKPLTARQVRDVLAYAGSASREHTRQLLEGKTDKWAPGTTRFDQLARKVGIDPGKLSEAEQSYFRERLSEDAAHRQDKTGEIPNKSEMRKIAKSILEHMATVGSKGIEEANASYHDISQRVGDALMGLAGPSATRPRHFPDSHDETPRGLASRLAAAMGAGEVVAGDRAGEDGIPGGDDIIRAVPEATLRALSNVSSSQARQLFNAAMAPDGEGRKLLLALELASRDPGIRNDPYRSAALANLSMAASSMLMALADRGGVRDVERQIEMITGQASRLLEAQTGTATLSSDVLKAAGVSKGDGVRALMPDVMTAIDHRAQSVRHAMEMQMDELREQGVEQGTDVF
jgi:hypothetical protein